MRITFYDGISDIFAFEGKMAGFDGEMSAHREAYEVVCVSERTSLVKIVHTPDQAPFDVSPRPEILDMEVAHREHMRSFRELRTCIRPKLRPAIVGGTKERENTQLHAGMLDVKVFGDDIGAVRQPLLKVASRFDDVHGDRHDIRWAEWKSTEAAEDPTSHTFGMRNGLPL